MSEMAMLPSDLLISRKYRDKITPVYARLNKANMELADRLIKEYQTHLGRKKGELEEVIEDLEGCDQDYRLVRGLSTLLERRSHWDMEARIDPEMIRDHLFHKASEGGIPTTLERREELVRETAEELGVPLGFVEEGLYADLEEELILREFQPISPSNLIRLYNLGLTQTLLFKSTEMEFMASGNWQRIFRGIKWLGLIYTIQKTGEGYQVKVDGPVSLFKLNHRYGTRMAKLLPEIIEADEWKIQALVMRRRGDPQLLKLDIDNLRHGKYLKRAGLPIDEDYDSLVEENFAERFSALDSDWRITREPGPLPVGKRVMIPDFLFEKAGMKVYMEIAGFWTPGYLKRKLEQFRGVKDVDMIVAADRNHACRELEELTDRMNILYYKGEVPLTPIYHHLKSREEELKKKQLGKFKERKIKIDGDTVTLKELSTRLSVLEEAALELVKEREFPGYKLLGDILIREEILTHISEELARVMKEGELTYGEAVKIVEELGGARPSRVLEHLGYGIDWRTINPLEARIIRLPE
jgi:hypothetical protein